MGRGRNSLIILTVVILASCGGEPGAEQVARECAGVPDHLAIDRTLDWSNGHSFYFADGTNQKVIMVNGKWICPEGPWH
jgi:hypothetical protein